MATIATPTPKPTPPPAAVESVKELRKMAGATEIGINKREYSSRFIDLKATVDEALTEMPEGDLKKEVCLALEAYMDGAELWYGAVDGDYSPSQKTTVFLN